MSDLRIVSDCEEFQDRFNRTVVAFFFTQTESLNKFAFGKSDPVDNADKLTASNTGETNFLCRCGSTSSKCAGDLLQIGR